VRRSADCKRGHDQQASSEFTAIALEHALEAAWRLVWEGHLVRNRKGWYDLTFYQPHRYQPSAFAQTKGKGTQMPKKAEL
jgi:hypothetical protein